MKNKKVLSVMISLMMLILVCCSPFISYASFFVEDGDVSSCPGNTRVYTEAKDYNYAWLDSVILRDGSMAVTPLTVYPVSEYPYSHTCDEFIDECNNYVKLIGLSDTVVQNTIIDSLKTIYYTLVATGKITDSTQDMRAYNESCGILYPYTDSQFTDLYTVITYVCLNQNLYKLVSNEDVSITRGTTVEGAVVKFLSAVCGMAVPSSVDTVPAFSYLFTEKYVIEDSAYPVSENPTEEEVNYWVKLQAAQKAGYSVPATTKYENLTSEQIEYVTYAYDASVLTTRYEVPIDPMLLKAALSSSNSSDEVPRLVLKSMLDNSSVSYLKDETTQSLFNKAAQEGYFDLENEFYTDIYNYRIYVGPECEKIWITCFPIADQLDNGSINEVSTFINGSLVKNSSTNAVEVPADGTTFTVRTSYNGKSDTATYVFTVVKTGDAETMNEAPSIDLSDPLQDIASNISNVITGSTNNSAVSELPTVGFTFDSQLTTYDIGENTLSTEGYTGSLFNTYPTDEKGEVLTTRNPLEVTTEEETSASVLSYVSDKVRENPVVVAAPAGLAAIGASAGFMFYRKRREDEIKDTGEE